MKRSIKAADENSSSQDIVIDVAENLGWGVSVYNEVEPEVEFEYYCGNGMDGIAIISTSDWDDFAKELQDYAFYYDPEEEAMIQVQANGNPGIRAVLEDCDEFAEKLDELADAIKSTI